MNEIKRPLVTDLERKLQESQEETEKLKRELESLRKKTSLKQRVKSPTPESSRSPSPEVRIKQKKRKHVTERSFDSESETSEDDLRGRLDKKKRIQSGPSGSITITTVRDDTALVRKKLDKNK